MSDCPQESRIATAAANGPLPEDLVLHLAGCQMCNEAHSIAGKMRQIANELSEDPPPSVAAMWWRLNLRMRQDRVRQAEKPLVWMARIFYAAIALAMGSELASIPGLSGRTAVIGVAALGAIALPVAMALATWSVRRSD